MNFYVLCRGRRLPMPVPSGKKEEKYEILTNQKLRFMRLLIIVFWVLMDVAQTLYFKWGECNFHKLDWTNPHKSETVDWNKTELCEVAHRSYSCHFFGFVTGLLLGIALIETHSRKNKNVKKVFKIISACLFVGMLVWLFFHDYNYYLNRLGKNGINFLSTRCSLSTFEKKCQAKCYCGIKDTLIDEIEDFNSCSDFTICKYVQKFNQSEWKQKSGCTLFLGMIQNGTVL